MRKCAALRTDLPEDHWTSALRLVAGTSSSVARGNSKTQIGPDCGNTLCLTLKY